MSQQFLEYYYINSTSCHNCICDVIATVYECGRGMDILSYENRCCIAGTGREWVEQVGGAYSKKIEIHL